MIVSEIELFEALAKELGREKAKSLVEYVEAKVDKRLEDKTNVFATKEDIARIETKIAESKVETIKWLVGLIIGLFIALVGSLSAIIKLIVH
jgi:hypothetical protein